MPAIIRENPLHQPAQKPIGSNTTLPQINHVANQVAGPMFAHLGHFGQSGVLRAGHNTGAHPGFKAVESKIAAKEGVSEKRAGAILAASTRRASPAAKRANPRLKRVK